MEKKYELTNETVTIDNGEVLLHRIKATKDFGAVEKGDIGGWVESDQNLSQEGDCWIYDDAKVYGNARIFDSVRVYDEARVYGNTRAFNNSDICGNAKVYENASVYGNSTISDNAELYGHAVAHKYSKVYGNSKIYDNATVHGTVEDAIINNNAIISDVTLIKGYNDIIPEITTNFYQYITVGPIPSPVYYGDTIYVTVYSYNNVYIALQGSLNDSNIILKDDNNLSSSLLLALLNNNNSKYSKELFNELIQVINSAKEILKRRIIER